MQVRQDSMTIATSLNKAQRLERDAKLDDAARVYGDILKKFPKNARALKALNSLQHRMQSEQTHRRRCKNS